ncbi:MAG: NUDIX hydrolase [Thermoplasmata archaeon]
MHLRLNIKPVEPEDVGQSAAVMIITDRQSIALIRRKKRDDDPWSGQVAFPGGLRKRGESIQQTAVRETAEEVGVHVTPAGYIGSYRTHVRDLQVAAFFSVVPEEPMFSVGDEVEEVNWVRIDTLSPTTTDAGYPAYKYDQGVIWGLTYRILGACLEEFNK